MKYALPFVLLVACSGGGLTGSASAQAAMQGRFDTPDKTDCSVAGAQVGLGMFSESDAVSVADKSKDERGVNHIACRVADVGDEKLMVEGSLKSDDRVLFEIKGIFPKTTDVKGFKADQVTLSNGLADASYSAFTQSDGQCTVLYSTKEMGAVAGRVWGEVTCAKATPNGGAAAGTCVTITQFRFEDCTR